MKYRSLFVVWGVAICAWFASPNSASAQGTAFTYQGQLLSNNLATTGSYDMQFALRLALTGTNQAGSTLNVAPVGVTNGLFIVTLDFGNVFNVNPLFLEIGVRTNGSTNAYLILSPRQPVTSAPYAVQALNAATFTGSILDTQLSTNIPLLNGSQTFTGVTIVSNASDKFVGAFSGAASGTFSGSASGTFSGSTTGTNTGKFIGDGSGVTNVNITNVVGVVQSNPNWQLIQSSPQQAVSGNNYLTTNAANTTLILPASPNVGSTVWIAGSGANGWTVSLSGSQSILFNGLGVPAGQIWTQQATSQSWRCLASSANGQKLIAGIGAGVGTIYYSSDGGQTWHASDAPSRDWRGLASSADGTRMAAAPNGNVIYTSTNGGVNWMASASINTSWTSIASSANGLKLAAGVGIGVGFVHVSADGGSTWTSNSISKQWTGVASSADGTKLAACPNTGQIYVSTDSGVTWNPHGPSTSWTGIASSSEGSSLVACVTAGNVYTSGDGGVSWTARPFITSQSWTCVASSANGLALAAAYNAGAVYTSADGGQTWVQRSNGISTSAGWTALASSADGSRLNAAVGNSSGFIFNSIAQTTPGSGTLTGSQYSDVQLQYIGNNQWMALNFTGTFTGN